MPVHRDTVIQVRVTQKEAEYLRAKAKENPNSLFASTGKENLSGYIRQVVLEESGWKKSYHREIRELTYQIRKIGVNINQVTAKINRGYQGWDAIKELLENQKELEEKVEQVLKKLEE